MRDETYLLQLHLKLAFVEVHRINYLMFKVSLGVTANSFWRRPSSSFNSCSHFSGASKKHKIRHPTFLNCYERPCFYPLILWIIRVVAQKLIDFSVIKRTITIARRKQWIKWVLFSEVKGNRNNCITNCSLHTVVRHHWVETARCMYRWSCPCWNCCNVLRYKIS